MTKYVWMSAAYRLEHQLPAIYLFARDESGNREVFRVDTFRPYIYVPENEVHKITPDEELAGPATGVFGESVRKVYLKKPSDTNKFRDKFSKTWESDILFPVRFLIDKGIRSAFECQSDGRLTPCDDILVEPKRMYLDIEVHVNKGEKVPDPEKAPNQILTITVCEKLGKEKIVLKAHNYEEEGEMLKTFIELVQSWDPDIFIAWNIFFDLATIIGRCKNHSIGHGRLSPTGYVDIRGQMGMMQQFVEVQGRNVFDLLVAFKKFFHSKKFDSYSLDAIGSNPEVGVNMPKFEFDYQNHMNAEHMDMIVEYTQRDMDVMMSIDEKLHLTNHFDNVRRQAGCRLDDALATNRYTDALLLRAYSGKYVLPRKLHQEKKKFVGAYVFPPAKGIFDRVITLDFSAMYPTIVMSHNLSPEMLERDIARAEAYPDEYHHLANAYFHKQPKGVVPTIFEEMIKYRKRIKVLMNSYPEGSEERKIYDLMQYSAKSMTAAMYGYFGSEASRLYCPEIAAGITFAGRNLIQMCAKSATERGYKVLYGDTDSMLLQVDTDDYVEKGHELEKDLNTMLEEHGQKIGLLLPPKLEFETAYKRILFHGKKKRYAGLTSFYKGQPSDKIIIKGFEVRRSDAAIDSKTAQGQLLKMVLEGAAEKDVRDYLKPLLTNIDSHPLQECGLPLILRMQPASYKTQASIHSVLYANQYLGKSYGIDSRVYEFCLKKTPPDMPNKMQVTYEFGDKAKFIDVTRVCFEEGDIEEFKKWKPFINWKLQAEKVIEDKLSKITEVIGLTFSEIRSGHKQTTGEKWGWV